MMMETANLEEKKAWLAAIAAHTKYIQTVLKINAQVEASMMKAAARAPKASAPADASATGAAAAAATAAALNSKDPIEAAIARGNVVPAELSGGMAATHSTGALGVPSHSASGVYAAAQAAEHAAAAPAAADATKAASAVLPARTLSTSLSASAIGATTTATAGAAAGAAAKKPVVTTPLTASNDTKPWMVYVDQAGGETIVLTGEVNKPNPVGLQMLRQLILTSRKRLLYVDSKSLELKVRKNATAQALTCICICIYKYINIHAPVLPVHA
jgi:hypothetical protein